MLSKILNAFRKDVTTDEYMEIKKDIIENFTIRDLQAQVTYIQKTNETYEARIKKLEKQLDNALKEKEDYISKYCKVDIENINLVVSKAKLQSEYNNLLYRLQKYEGSPQQE